MPLYEELMKRIEGINKNRARVGIKSKVTRTGMITRALFKSFYK